MNVFEEIKKKAKLMDEDDKELEKKNKKFLFSKGK
jgi:hypothetical protein